MLAYLRLRKLKQLKELLSLLVINKQCIEIASGSPLTEKEINATKKSEINTECPSIQTLIMYLLKIKIEHIDLP